MFTLPFEAGWPVVPPKLLPAKERSPAAVEAVEDPGAHVVAVKQPSVGLVAKLTESARQTTARAGKQHMSASRDRRSIGISGQDDARLIPNVVCRSASE